MTPYRRGEKWRAILVQPDGRRKSASFDRRADAVAAEREAKRICQLVASGVMTEQEVRTAELGRTKVEDAIAAWEKDLTRRGCSSRHVVQQTRLARRVCAGALLVRSIRQEDLRTAMERSEQAGRSARTVRGLAEATRAFCSWLVAQGYLPRDPIGKVWVPPDRGGVRRVRALTVEESERLLAMASPRQSFYRLVLFTGIRWAEAARLEHRDLRPGELHMRREVTKNKKEAVVPLAAGVAACFPLSVNRERIFRAAPSHATFRMDLRAAGVALETEAGIANRASTRKSFATWMAAAGVEPGTADLLMRHESSIRTRHYLDKKQLLTHMRRGVEQLEQWYTWCASGAHRGETTANGPEQRA